MSVEITPTKKFYQLKVSLKDVSPSIWRQLLVASDTTLLHLHFIIQAAMGWENSHLFAFRIRGAEYTVPADEDLGSRNAGQFTLADVVTKSGTQFSYLYDFGDSWDHLIQVEMIKPASDTPVPVCLKGKRACPPEDCGGVWGYMQLLNTLKNPKDADYESLIEWLGDGFNPEAFDLKETNEDVAQLAIMPEEVMLNEDMMLPDAMFGMGNQFDMVKGMLESFSDPVIEDWLSPHRAHLAAQMMRHLANFVTPHDLGFVMGAGAVFETEDGQFSPSVSFFAKSSLPSLPNAGVMNVLPHLAIEIELPENKTIREELKESFKAYKKAQITTWHLLPLKKQIKISQPDAKDKTLGIGDILDGGDILPGFELAVSELFSQ